MTSKLRFVHWGDIQATLRAIALLERPINDTITKEIE